MKGTLLDDLIQGCYPLSFCYFISEKISFFIHTKKSESTSPSLLWETLKAVIRGEIISYSARVSKQGKQRQQELLEAIRQIDNQHSSSPIKQRDSSYKLNLGIFSTNKAEHLLRRAKSSYYEDVDKASRLLALQLRHQAVSRIITPICRTPCTTVTDPVEINNNFAQYYTNLYKSEAPSDKYVMNTFLDNFGFPVIDDTTRNSLDIPLRLEEVTATLKLMQNGKAPGPDGFPVDFKKM